MEKENTIKFNHTFIHATRAWCPDCNKVEHASIIHVDDGVFLERSCPVNGKFRSKIANSLTWYKERIANPHIAENPLTTKEAKNGCPLDCGICNWHSTALHLPVFSITNDCNLDCPKCFTYNRTDKKYYKTIDDTRKIISAIKKANPDIQLINITGGEPTLHPQLFEILDLCHQEGIKRITMNTNGLRIAESYEFAEKLKNANIQVILSMDTLNPKNSKKIYGRDIVSQKLKTLEILEELNISTTLLLVCIKGINEKDVLEITEKFLPKRFVRSITIQNMTYTGKNGQNFHPRDHITIDEVEDLLCENDSFSKTDFAPLGSYHPLCYSTAYYISIEENLIPLSDVFDNESLRKLTSGKYLIEPDKDFSEDFMNSINNIWANEPDPEKLMLFKKLIKKVFPNDGSDALEKRLEEIESLTKIIYIHPHMDTDNFDIDRVSRCGDLVPDESGDMIPACSYNLLYRQKDPRFWIEDQD